MITYLVIAFLSGESFALAFDSKESCLAAGADIVTTDVDWMVCKTEGIKK